MLVVLPHSSLSYNINLYSQSSLLFVNAQINFKLHLNIVDQIY